MNILHRSKLILKKAINSYCSVFLISMWNHILSQLSNVFTFPAKELFLSKTLKTIRMLGIVSNSCFFPLSLSACKCLATVATDMLLKPGCRDAIWYNFPGCAGLFPQGELRNPGTCMYVETGGELRATEGWGLKVASFQSPRMAPQLHQILFWKICLPTQIRFPIITRTKVDGGMNSGSISSLWNELVGVY